MSKSEIQIQADAFQRVWNDFPETRYKIWHVPNGGKRTMTEALQLKASGVVAGVSDIHMAWKGRLYIWEFKDDKGSLSKEQKRFIEAMAEELIVVKVVRDAETFYQDVKRIIYGS